MAYKCLHEVYYIIACPVKGQVRKECASHPSCHQTCNNTGPFACPAICVVNGCECPPGTVIDEDINECVTPRECEGIKSLNLIKVLSTLT